MAFFIRFNLTCLQQYFCILAPIMGYPAHEYNSKIYSSKQRLTNLTTSNDQSSTDASSAIPISLDSSSAAPSWLVAFLLLFLLGLVSWSTHWLATVVFPLLKDLTLPFSLDVSYASQMYSCSYSSHDQRFECENGALSDATNTWNILYSSGIYLYCIASVAFVSVSQEFDFHVETSCSHIEYKLWYQDHQKICKRQADIE